MTVFELVERLADTESRRQSVLVFGGTGTSMWRYYPFLRQFSIAALSDFKRIYGISGGAACAWYYVLQQLGLFDDAKIALYEPGMRALSGHNLVGRIWRLLKNDYVYDAQVLADRIADLACPKARHLAFSQFPLENFTAVADDYVNGAILYLSRQSAPTQCMGDAMASLSAPRLIRGRLFCRPIKFRAFGITDFDFADRRLRDDFKEKLRSEHAPENIFWLNTRFSAIKGHITYVKVGSARFPKLGDAIDAFAFLLGIPNGRILAASKSLS